jgi:hypothetical protein
MVMWTVIRVHRPVRSNLRLRILHRLLYREQMIDNGGDSQSDYEDHTEYSNSLP